MAVVKMLARGQITIPASLRSELGIEENSVLNIVKVGDSVLLTQKRIAGDKLARSAGKAMAKEGITLKDLLEDLKKQREVYNREKHGI
jgi:AbrB family looped-hinge helix DNA binding protein